MQFSDWDGYNYTHSGIDYTYYKVLFLHLCIGWGCGNQILVVAVLIALSLVHNTLYLLRNIYLCQKY